MKDVTQVEQIAIGRLKPNRATEFGFDGCISSWKRIRTYVASTLIRLQEVNAIL